MSCAVDTNILIDLVAGQQSDATQIATILEHEGAKGALVISAPVYAECLAFPRWTHEKLDRFLSDTNVVVEWGLERPIWIRAGEAFAAYSRTRSRSGGGKTRRILADFVIGAHAEAVGSLVTRDLGFYRTYFSKLNTIVP